MIKYITSSSPFITVSGGGASGPYISMSNPSAGMMRYNGNSSNIEVYDGSIWQILQGSSASVDTSFEANQLFEWARKKMLEEQEWQRLSSDNEAVKIARENFKKAEEQLRITAILAKEQNETTTN